MEKAFKGIDISKHQASYNPAAAMAQGVRHVVVRTNYANTVDTLAAQFGKAALPAGQQAFFFVPSLTPQAPSFASLYPYPPTRARKSLDFPSLFR